MAFSFLPKEDEYFDLFSQMTAKIKEGGDMLVDMLNGSFADFEAASKRIKSVETECDDITHSITTKLNSSFITPFDREDIYTLAVGLDDVCDYIDAAARAVVMYDIQELDEHAKQLASILKQLTYEIHNAVGLLKKAKGMKPHLVEIQRLENEADEAYFKGIANLFKTTKDPVMIIKMKELFEILENGTDLCESVGNSIESIVLKHN